MLSVSGGMEPLPRLFVPVTTTESIRVNQTESIRPFPFPAVSMTTPSDSTSPVIKRDTSSPSSPASSSIRSTGSSIGPAPSMTTPPSFSSTSFGDIGCSEIGRCQDGREIRFSFLANKGFQINRPNGFVLVGARSPQLGATTLLAIVDRSYLPDEDGRASQGFVGDCVGCGRRFRFFTEFSHHINLKLATQPKKQKHLKYYIETTSNGELIRGKPLGWKVLPETRRRSRAGSFLDILPGSPSVFGPRLNVNCLQISLPTQLPPSSAYASYSMPPPSKKICWEGIDIAENTSASLAETRKGTPNTPTDIALPIILVCQKDIPVLSSNTKMLPVSLLLKGTFVNETAQPPGGDRASRYNVQSPHLPALLAIHYFSSLLPDTPIRREDADAFIESASKEISSTLTQELHQRGEAHSQNQFSSLARLVSSCSSGRLEVIFCPNLTEGLDTAYTNVKSKRLTGPTKVPVFTIIIQCSDNFWQSEFIVMVSGTSHLCYLVWALGDDMAEDEDVSDEEEEAEEEIDVVSRVGNKEIKCSSPLSASFGSTDELLIMLKNFKSSLGGDNQAPFKSSHHLMKEEDIIKLTPESPVVVDTNILSTFRDATPDQVYIGDQLFCSLKIISEKSSTLDISHFVKVGVGFITAPFYSAYVQMVERVLHSELLQALGIEESPDYETVEQYVFKADSDMTENTKFVQFIDKAEKNMSTLFFLVHDDAHVQSTAHQWVNSQAVLSSTNIVVLQMSSTPYCLQSVASKISNEYRAEIHWDNLPEQYCGIKFYKSSRDDVSQSPLIRSDNTFERMVIKKMSSDQQTKPVSCRINILTRHYSAAMVCVCRVNFAESFTTAETMQVAHELVETPLKNPSGHGVMVVVRIASEKLGRLAFERLRLVRDSLGLRFRFAVVLDTGSGPYNIDPYFLSRLRMSQKDRTLEWRPCRPEHLANLPCLMVRTGAVRAGDTFPCSLRYYDMRAFCTVTQSRTVLEQEIGNLYGYSSPLEALFIRPRCLVPSQVLPYIEDADLPGRSMLMLPHVNCQWLLRPRPTLKLSSTPAEQSRYYREYLLSLSDMEYVDTSGSNTFHNKRLLLTGPKQVGKTGACFHFLRLVQQFLKQQQEVEVVSVTQAPSTKSTEEFRNWPTYSNMEKQEKEERRGEDYTGLIKGKVVNVNYTQHTTHSSYHFCERCQAYRFGTAQRNYFQYKIDGEELLFWVPEEYLDKFYLPLERRGHIHSLLLAALGDDTKGIMSTIFTPSKGRHHSALLNLYHALEGQNHTHIVVISRGDMESYLGKWTNHILMILPESADNMGYGVYRYWIKKFATHNYNIERQRCTEDKVWPFALVMDDSCAAWTMSKWSKTDHTDKTEKSISLYQMLCHMETTPDIQNYAMLSSNHWSQSNDVRTPFDRDCSRSFNMLNLDLLQGIDYNKRRHMAEQTEFLELVSSAGLVCCRFNYLHSQFRNMRGGGDNLLQPKVVLPTTLFQGEQINVSKLICAPDKPDSYNLPVPPHYLLECFLHLGSAERLFHTAVDDPKHPILMLNCYFDLGPSLTTHCVSGKNTPDKATEYGGLLLYFWSNAVQSNILNDLKFKTGAKLCIVAKDRETLRENIVSLDLEDTWRFRFRDEFRTASKDRPIYFLTGTHE